MTRQSTEPNVHYKRGIRGRVELVRWIPISSDYAKSDYELVAGTLIDITPEAFIVATDDGERAYPRRVWLLCEGDDEEQAA